MRHCTQCGAATPEDARFCPKCGAPVATSGSGDPMLGKVIADRYLLVEKIGQGGSGTIYRGEHTTLRKRVAVKVLHAQLSTDDTALERFRREATTVAELDNDHILQVIDFGRTEDKRLFFAMEYLEGETLTKVLEREKQLPIVRAVDILTQIAEALIEAHGLGYVHRDLRPRNVFLINKRGRADFVKLLDFGLAKLVLPNAEAKQTAMGMTFGDPRYMSPEQARGEALDGRSDLYSLGAIAFEMLTGTPPYHGSGTFEILQLHLDAPVPRVRDRRPDCPEWLDAVVYRALAKRPEGRFVTALKMLEPLRAQQPPAAADAAEKAEHARLSSQRPGPAAATASPPAASTLPLPSAPTAPAPVQSMGPPPTATSAVEPKPPSPRETQAFTSRPPKNAPPPAQLKKADKGADAAPRVETKKPEVAPAATSGSVDVTPPALKAPPAPANVPSVVVESNSQEKTVPAKLPGASAAAPTFEDRPTTEKPLAPPLPPPPPPDSAQPARRKDPTGEWFSSDSQPMKTIPGATYDDDLDELPTKHRGPIIIAAVSGSLFLIGLIVFALLPKPAHKPLRGEQPTTPASAAPAQSEPAKPTASPSAPASPAGTPSGSAAAPSGGVATPSGAAAAPSGAAAAPSGVAAAPSGVAAAPSGGAAAPSGGAAAPSRVAATPSGASAAPSGAAVPPARAATSPSGVTTRPTAAIVPPSGVAGVKPPASSPRPTPPPATPKTVAAEKPAAKEPPARVERVEKEKPARVAAADKPARVAAAEKPAPTDKRKRDKGVPDGFRDPFNDPKATAPSSSESAQAEFFVKLGRQKLNASDLTAAAANFNKAREYDSRSSEAIAGLGEVSFEQGDYAGAAVHLKQALRLSPNRSRYLVLLGQTYYKLGKPKEAVGEYKKALRIDPNNQEAQHSLDVAERKLGTGG